MTGAFAANIVANAAKKRANVHRAGIIGVKISCLIPLMQIKPNRYAYVRTVPDLWNVVKKIEFMLVSFRMF